MQRQAEADAERKRQEESIFALQARVASLHRENDQLHAAQRQLEQQRDAALLRAAPDASPDAGEVADRTHEELARLAGELVQVQQWLARLETVCTGSARDLDSRLEQSMQRLIDRFTRAVVAATSPPIENRVEATDALLGKMLDDEPEKNSNIQDVVVIESRSGHSIERSLERLRKTRKSPGAAAPNGSKDGSALPQRRRGPSERRTGPSTPREAGSERRNGPDERRTR
jgi:hypothetical protein